MFEHVEEKLKSTAKGNLYYWYTLAGLIALYFLVEAVLEEEWGILLDGILYFSLCVGMGRYSSWTLYAYAETLEGNKIIQKQLDAMNETLKYIFRGNIQKNQEEDALKEEKIAAEKAKAAEETALARKKREEEAHQLAEQRQKERQEAEKERLAKVEAYWAEHQEEKEALLKKKAEAEEKLKQLDTSALEEQKMIRNLITQIDFELTKSR